MASFHFFFFISQTFLNVTCVSLPLFSTPTIFISRLSERTSGIKFISSNLLNYYINLYLILFFKPKKISVCLSVCLDVWMYVRTWTFHVDTITFEGVSGSKQNLVGVFCVWNVGLELKSEVISWSWFWTEFWFSQKLCGATTNLMDIFSIWRITLSNEFHSEILILVMIVILTLIEIRLNRRTDSNWLIENCVNQS